MATSYHNWTYYSTSNRNVIGEQAGTTSASEVVLITAHLDDMPSSGPAPGADDNASAVAVLLDLGRRLGQSPPECRVELVAYTLEEPPYFATDAETMRAELEEIATAAGETGADGDLESTGAQPRGIL